MNKPVREGFVKEQEAPPQITVDVGASDVPQEMAPAGPPPETWPVTVRLLHKPVRNNKGELIKELNFREPTAADIMRIGGNPVRLNDKFETIIEDAKMLTLMANLSGVLEPFLQQMDPRDFNSCAYRLRNFFLPEAAAWFPEMSTT
jgi:Phage tail assembly chaperone proteins, E, or 41 or 14